MAIVFYQLREQADMNSILLFQLLLAIISLSFLIFDACIVDSLLQIEPIFILLHSLLNTVLLEVLKEIKLAS